MEPLYRYLIQGNQPLANQALVTQLLPTQPLAMSTESVLPSQVVAPMSSIQNVPPYPVQPNMGSASMFTSFVPTNPVLVPHQQTQQMVSTHHI